MGFFLAGWVPMDFKQGEDKFYNFVPTMDTGLVRIGNIVAGAVRGLQNPHRTHIIIFSVLLFIFHTLQLCKAHLKRINSLKLNRCRHVIFSEVETYNII